MSSDLDESLDSTDLDSMLPTQSYKVLLNDYTDLKDDFDVEKRRNINLTSQINILKAENEKLKAENVSLAKVIHDLSSELSKLSRGGGKKKHKRTRKK